MSARDGYDHQAHAAALDARDAWCKARWGFDGSAAVRALAAAREALDTARTAHANALHTHEAEGRPLSAGAPIRWRTARYMAACERLCGAIAYSIAAALDAGALSAPAQRAARLRALRRARSSTFAIDAVRAEMGRHGDRA